MSDYLFNYVIVIFKNFFCKLNYKKRVKNEQIGNMLLLFFSITHNRLQTEISKRFTSVYITDGL